MKKLIRTLFAIPWLIFGIQHFMYLDFVANLVPAFMPLRTFWAGFTGVAMIAASISLLINKKSSLAAALLAVMLIGFILLIHIPALIGKPMPVYVWTRPVQDLAIAASAFLLAYILSPLQTAQRFLGNVATISRYVLALCLLAFGAQQFLNLDFLTAKVPAYLPLRSFWVYLTGFAMVITGVSCLLNKRAKLMATFLGTWLLVINFLNYVYLLATDLHNPRILDGCNAEFDNSLRRLHTGGKPLAHR